MWHTSGPSWLVGPCTVNNYIGCPVGAELLTVFRVFQSGDILPCTSSTPTIATPSTSHPALKRARTPRYVSLTMVRGKRQHKAVVQWTPASTRKVPCSRYSSTYPTDECSASLKVSHLHYAQDALNGEGAPPSEIPSGLPYTAAAFREDDIEMVRLAETTNDRPLVPQSDTAGGQSMDAQASQGISTPGTTMPAEQLSRIQSRSGERATDVHSMITGDAEESRDHDAGNPMDLDAVPEETQDVTAVQHDGSIGKIPDSQLETQLLDVPAETALASGSQQTTQVLDEDWQAKVFFQKIVSVALSFTYARQSPFLTSLTAPTAGTLNAKSNREPRGDTAC